MRVLHFTSSLRDDQIQADHTEIDRHPISGSNFQSKAMSFEQTVPAIIFIGNTFSIVL
jgi:hypothetical protein